MHTAQSASRIPGDPSPDLMMAAQAVTIAPTPNTKVNVSSKWPACGAGTLSLLDQRWETIITSAEDVGSESFGGICATFLVLLVAGSAPQPLMVTN